MSHNSENSRSSTPSKRVGFEGSRRFARDGHSIPNFLNGRDGEGRELSPERRDANTCTHTVFKDHLCGSSLPTFTDITLKSLSGRATLLSVTGRVDHSSMAAGDTRFLSLEPPYSPVLLGPGSYDIDNALPSVGLLRADSPLRSGTPSLDPTRLGSPFRSPPRSPLWKPGEFAGLTPYLNSSYKGFNDKDKAPMLYSSSYRRPEVADYRYSTRHSELKKEVPVDMDAPDIDRSGRPITLAAKIQSVKPAAVPFMSKRSRFEDRSKASPPEVKTLHQQLVVRLEPPNSHSCPGSPRSYYASYATYVLPDKRPESFQQRAVSTRRSFSY